MIRKNVCCVLGNEITIQKVFFCFLDYLVDNPIRNIYPFTHWNVCFQNSLPFPKFLFTITKIAVPSMIYRMPVFKLNPASIATNKNSHSYSSSPQRVGTKLCKTYPIGRHYPARIRSRMYKQTSQFSIWIL